LANECYFGTNAGKIGELFTHMKWYVKERERRNHYSYAVNSDHRKLQIRAHGANLPSSCVHHHVHSRQPSDPILHQLNTLHTTFYSIQYTDVRRVLLQF